MPMAASHGAPATVEETPISSGDPIISGKISEMNLSVLSGETCQRTFSLLPALLSVSALTSQVSMETEKEEEAL